MKLSGQATAAATQELAKTSKNLTFRELGNTGLHTSILGFGTYRVSIESDYHRQALEEALLSGINLIDTSSNYTNGNAERLIGEVLSEFIANHQLRRDQIIVVSKAGYIQGENIDIWEAIKEAPEAWKDVLEIESGLAHCIHPTFLKDQITNSLDRLQMDCIDCYLLHNPEA